MFCLSRLGAILAVAAVAAGASCAGPFTVRQAFVPAPDWECVAVAVRASRQDIRFRNFGHGYQWLVADWTDSDRPDHKQEVGIMRPATNGTVSDTIIVISSWANKKPSAPDVQVVTTFAAHLFDAISAACKTTPRSDRICELNSEKIACA